jgi:hypothetical protein
MNDEALIEHVARALAARDGHDPDCRVLMGAPYRVTEKTVGLPFSAATIQPIWTVYWATAETAIVAIEQYRRQAA